MLQFLVSLGTALFILFGVLLPACAYLILLERKVAAWSQDRIGPNRTNFSFGFLYDQDARKIFGVIPTFGLGQALADGIKLLLKEDYTPPHVDKVLFFIAPAITMIPAVIGWAVIPWGGLVEVNDQIVSVAVAPINIGVIYILAVSSLGVYGIVLGSYGSNNKYSFLGGLRATAQMLSYEIPMGVIVLIMILVYATADAGYMSVLQTGTGYGLTWGIFLHPLLAILFFITILAETNRAPFDLAEAEQELVGGFHTEYGSMRWALFFLGEYMSMITGSAFFCVLFLGGWDLIPFVPVLPPIADGWFLEGTDWAWAGTILLTLVKTHVFFGKILVLLFIMMWVRWTLPRFRYDQLMAMAWRGLIPITIAMLLITTLIVFADGAAWWYTVANVAMAIVAASVGMILPRVNVNRKIPLAGSRFSPLRPV